MKNWIIGILVLVILVWGGYMIFGGSSAKEVVVNEEPATTTDNPQTVATTTAGQENRDMYVIGKSVEGRDIVAYSYGNGLDEVWLVGGIHGGYEWNTSILTNQLRDYFKANPSVVPANIHLTLIPNLNPDGLFRLTGTTTEFVRVDASMPVADTVASRLNSNKVDLSRNFDCQWQPIGMWQTKKVSGGSAAFSEPESLAVLNYINEPNTRKPRAVVVYYSAAGGVYSSACGAGILPETAALTSLYAKASGYKAYDKFDAYPTSGDMVNWLAKINVPAISVLLTNHTDTEFDKNLAGVKAVLTRYAK